MSMQQKIYDSIVKRMRAIGLPLDVIPEQYLLRTFAPLNAEFEKIPVFIQVYDSSFNVVTGLNIHAASQTLVDTLYFLNSLNQSMVGGAFKIAMNDLSIQYNWAVECGDQIPVNHMIDEAVKAGPRAWFNTLAPLRKVISGEQTPSQAIHEIAEAEAAKD